MNHKETFRAFIEAGDISGATAYGILHGLSVTRADLPTLAKRDALPNNATMRSLFDALNHKRIEEEGEALERLTPPPPLAPGESLTPLADFAAKLTPIERFYYNNDRAIDLDDERKNAAIYRFSRGAHIEARASQVKSEYEAASDRDERARLAEELTAIETELAALAGASNG